MTAWIQKLNRTELTKLFEENRITSDGTIDDLRRRLREFIKENPKAISPPSTEPPSNTMPREQASPAVRSGPSIDFGATYEIAPPPASPLPPSVYLPEPARVLDQIRKWGCHFDGREPALFLERVEELRRGYHLADTHLLHGLPELLRRNPLLWARNRQHAWVTWSDFCTEFRAQYYPWQYAKQMHREADRRKQRPGETPRTRQNYKHSLVAPGISLSNKFAN
jgi:hypothetical protein